jgi:hypothetical protein
LALLAIGVAIGSWFRPVPTSKPAPGPTYTSQEIADAKSKVCTAFGKVHTAIQLTGARDRGPDYATQLASAVNARQALVAGSQYLSTILNDTPATPLISLAGFETSQMFTNFSRFNYLTRHPIPK